MVSSTPTGSGTSRCVRIYRMPYGAGTASFGSCSKDPYRLARDRQGPSAFLTADALARRLGSPGAKRDDPRPGASRTSWQRRSTRGTAGSRPARCSFRARPELLKRPEEQVAEALELELADRHGRRRRSWRESVRLPSGAPRAERGHRPKRIALARGPRTAWRRSDPAAAIQWVEARNWDHPLAEPAGGRRRRSSASKVLVLTGGTGRREDDARRRPPPDRLRRVAPDRPGRADGARGPTPLREHADGGEDDPPPPRGRSVHRPLSPRARQPAQSRPRRRRRGIDDRRPPRPLPAGGDAAGRRAPAGGRRGPAAERRARPGSCATSSSRGPIPAVRLTEIFRQAAERPDRRRGAQGFATGTSPT